MEDNTKETLDDGLIQAFAHKYIIENSVKEKEQTYDAIFAACLWYADQQTSLLKEENIRLKEALLCAKHELESFIPVTDVNVLDKITNALNKT